MNLRTPHPSENYYPLRPELMESTYFSYLANGDPRFLSMGKQMIENLNSFARVEHGFAGIKNVKEKTHDDKMHSFFLAETCKYLYLLFDDDNFVHNTGNWLFTTEGHLFPVMYEIQQTFQDRLLVFATKISPETGVSGNSVESKRKSCSLDGHSRSSWINELVNSDSFDQRCSADYDRRVNFSPFLFITGIKIFIFCLFEDL